MDYMTESEVKRSAAFGNAIAVKIATGKKVAHHSAIRHAISEQSRYAATALAIELLGVSALEATRLVDYLIANKPDDIVSPHHL